MIFYECGCPHWRYPELRHYLATTREQAIVLDRERGIHELRSQGRRPLPYDTPQQAIGAKRYRLTLPPERR